MSKDPSMLDAADTDVINPEGWVPNVVESEPSLDDVLDNDEDSDS